ncbi:MAG: Flp pilus assembly complex ATPase component TadA, partial [Candidatus Omnitrophica bacterium]|nr:Flp pilus assembly complex ATPase component TadA [Candidatus Omnitrophota bacterium]
MNTIIQDKYLPFLEKQGIIKKHEKEQILKEADMHKDFIANVLVKKKYVQDIDIEEFLHTEIGVTVVDPRNIEIPSDVLQCVNKDIAKKYHVIPVKLDNNVLSIAVINPLDIIAIDDLRIILDRTIKPLCALPYKIEEAYQKLYEAKESMDEHSTKIDDIIAEVESDDLEVVTHKEDARIDDLLQAAEQTPVIKITDLLLSEGIKRRASDIFIEPWEKHMTVRCRVDGLLEEMKAPPRQMANFIVSRIKVLSKLDIAERRMPQDGRFKIKYQSRYVDIRVSVLPSSFGEKVCLRILDKSAQAQSIEKLGFSE